MDYLQINNLALSYADRQDPEVVDRMDDFLRLVESRITRKLKIMKMSFRAQLPMVLDQEYYGLPPDFRGLRDIQVIQDGGEAITLHYIAPEKMRSELERTEETFYYTIVSDQIQTTVSITDTTSGILEIVYYKGVPALTAVETTNWVSDDYPDAYVFGLLVEISSFVKDIEAASLWGSRFDESISEIDTEDATTRWSGPTLQIRIE